jgi:putative hydrolase of the HAD superfamily
MALADCETLMLDMDGTLLDLAYDNYMWMEHIPAAFARQNALSEDEAKQRLRETFLRLEGKLDWYCLDHWSEALGRRRWRSPRTARRARTAAEPRRCAPDVP